MEKMTYMTISFSTIYTKDPIIEYIKVSIDIFLIFSIEILGFKIFSL